MLNAEEKTALIEQAKNGNVDSLNVILDTYKSNVYAVAFAMLKNKEDAEDATQQALITIWRNIHHLKKIEAFETWLYHIAYTRSLNILKSRSHYEVAENDSDDIYTSEVEENELFLPSEYAEREDLRERLFRIIDSLSAVQRETIVLYYFDDKNVTEISQIMDCSEGTVKSRLYHARNYIKNSIMEQEEQSGEKFFGIALDTLPIGQLITESVKADMPSAEEFANIIDLVKDGIFEVGSGVDFSVENDSFSKNGTVSSAKKTVHIGAKIAGASVGVVAVAVATVIAVNSILNTSTGNIRESLNSTEISMVQTYTEAKTEKATTVPKTNPTEQETTKAVIQTDPLRNVYLKYRDVLIKNKEKIDMYNWQYKDDPEHPIVFADVMGDSTPEMIYIYSDNDVHEDDRTAKLDIVTFNGTDAVTACTYDMDGYSNRMGGGVFAFQIKGEKNLYTYYRQNGMFNNELYCRFVEKGDYKLEAKEVVYYQNNNGLGVEMDGRVSGKTVSEKEAKNARDNLIKNDDTLLLSSSNGMGESYPRTLGITAENQSMTYAEAINFLSDYIDKTQTDENDFSIISGAYHSVNNGMQTEYINIYSDGTFRSELSGNYNDGLLETICNGRVNDFTHTDGTEYTFYAADTELENAPETTDTKYINGNPVTVTHTDSTFNSGQKFRFYKVGTNPDSISNFDSEAYTMGVPHKGDTTSWKMIVTSSGRIYIDNFN
ncbi:RNA polymerase sigma factor [Ruminococcus bromii]|uniref:RNA polymerase sigma factor n=1 Tax=Ruminococcus bromii TaxID=40518 RepID=UPI003AB6ADA2